MRFFLITFSLVEKWSLGTLCLARENFFTHADLVLEVRKSNPYIRDIMIVNIYEFRDEEDYLIYISGTKISEEERFQRWKKTVETHILEKMKLAPDIISSILTSEDFLRECFSNNMSAPVTVMNYFERH